MFSGLLRVNGGVGVGGVMAEDSNVIDVTDRVTIMLTQGELAMVIDALRSMGSHMTSGHRQLHAELSEMYQGFFGSPVEKS